MSGGNYIAYNLGLNPAVNFNFMLRVEGVFDLPCKSVRAFQKENEYEMIQEGGLNDYVHLRRKPISKPFTIQVERYVGVDLLDPLPNGTELVLPLVLYINRYSVYKEFHPVRMYVFSGCTVMSKEYGELNAEQSGLLTEITTIAYREMYIIENPATSFVTEDTWEFSETSKEGAGKRKANIRRDLVPEEGSKQEFAGNAVQWKFKETTKEGNGVRRKNTFITENKENINSEKTKAELEKSAKTWMFKEGNRDKKNQESKKDMIPSPVTGAAAEQPAFRGVGGSANDNDFAKNEIRKEEMKKSSVRYDLSENKGKNKRAKTSSEKEYNYKTKEEMKKTSVKYDLSQDKIKNERAVTSSTAEYKYQSKAAMEKASVKYSFTADKKKNKRAVTVEDFMKNGKI